jgi:hypothetical protein
MRAALLASKRAIDSKASSNREELLRSSVLKQTKTSDGKATYVMKHMFFGFSLMLFQRGRSDEGPGRCHGCPEKDNGIDAERIRALRPIHTDAWLVPLCGLLRVGC